MAVRLRLRREGTKKRPHYRVVAADKRSPRNGKFIEIIGEYHPLDDPSTILIDEERALHWLEHGAQPSDQVKKLLRIVGVWEQFKPDDEPLRDRSTDKPKLSKKAKAKLAAGKEAATAAAAEEPEVEEPEVEEPEVEEPEVEEPVAQEPQPEVEPEVEEPVAKEPEPEPEPEPEVEEPVAEEAAADEAADDDEAAGDEAADDDETKDES